MRHVQRGGSIEESQQESVTFDGGTPEAISAGINNTCKQMAVRVVSVAVWHVPVHDRGPFFAIVVFEEDIR